jgi:DNA-binding beta-propeller fold protein YncE
MFLNRLLKGSAIAGIGLLLTFLSISASAETYSFRNQIDHGLSAPLDVAVGRDGRAYIADQSNFRILQVDEYDNFANQCLFGQSVFPLALAVDPGGGVYYATRFSGTQGDIIRFNSLHSCLDSTEIGTPTQLIAPFGIAVAPDGSFFVSDSYNNRIEKFDPAGNFVKAWGTLGNAVPDPDLCQSGMTEFCDAQFYFPKGLAVLPFGGTNYLIVADTSNNRLQVFDMDGNFLAAAGSLGAGEFNSPDGVAVGPDGNLYISDTGNNRILKFSLGDGSISEVDDGTVSTPEGLAVDQGGNVYVADSDNNRVAVFTPDVVVFENGSSSKVITGNDPFGAVFSIVPDVYWQNAPEFELYLWLEAFGVKAYWAGLPLDLVVFSLPTEMKPLASVQAGVPAVNNLNLTFLNDSSVVLPGTYTLHLCLDRDVNGTYNPSASVCGSIDIVRQ